MNLVTYEGIEPFGGLREDTQELRWDDIKRNFLKAVHPNGIYLYHKSGSNIPFMLFQSDNGSCYQLMSPECEGMKFNIVKMFNVIDKDLYHALMVTRVPMLYSKFLNMIKTNDYIKEFTGSASKKQGNVETIFSTRITQSNNKEFIGKTLNQILGDKSKNTETNKEEGPKPVFPYADFYRNPPKVNISDCIKLSEDCGIVNPSTESSGTALGKLDNTGLYNFDNLVKIGYTKAPNKMTATSQEINFGSYDYHNRPKLGKAERTFRDATHDSLAGVNVNIGWAGSPSGGSS